MQPKKQPKRLANFFGENSNQSLDLSRFRLESRSKSSLNFFEPQKKFCFQFLFLPKSQTWRKSLAGPFLPKTFLLENLNLDQKSFFRARTRTQNRKTRPGLKYSNFSDANKLSNFTSLQKNSAHQLKLDGRESFMSWLVLQRRLII